MTTIDPNTFTATAEANSYGTEDGTVRLNLRQGQITAKAYRFKDGEIGVRGFIGRYRTSPKAWPASVIFKVDGTIRYARFGRDDRSGRFNKQDMISWNPEAYEAAR